MLLSLDDDHKAHLLSLKDLSSDVVREFCRISIEFIKKGISSKMYQSAAQKLGVEAAVVEHIVQALMYLYSETATSRLTDLDFQDSLLAIGFSEEVTKDLLDQYVSHQVELRRVLTQMAPDLPHYHNLQWRLDIQLASRSLHHQVEPQILLKLHTKDGDEDKVTLLQTDPVNLIHLTKSLENALQELKSSHSRRILRNI